MAAVLDHRDFEITRQLEARALERMLSALCEQIGRACRDVVNQPGMPSRETTRETALQYAAFVERREQALRALGERTNEPHEIRTARLERLIEALLCSRAYFCGQSAR